MQVAALVLGCVSLLAFVAWWRANERHHAEVKRHARTRLRALRAEDALTMAEERLADAETRLAEREGSHR
jgi:hypothetical protein